MSQQDTFPHSPSAMADTELFTTKADASVPLLEREADDLIGARLHHFRVEDPIGQGGMGSVYRALDLSLQRRVALKVLPRTFAEERPELVERFKREARSQARLSHPHVVPIYYIGEEEGLHFFAMELVEGTSLEDYFEQSGRLDPEEAIEFMIQIAGALSQAKTRDLIHRDLKPANLLITADKRVKVADFGLAKPLDEGSKELTREGSFMGTPLYIAPEQANGEELDHRADMYSLGASFYHLLTGRPVFDAPTPMAVAIKHVTEPPPDIHALRDDLPQGLVRIIARLLAKNRADRFDNYDGLRDALELIRQKKNPPAGLVPRAIATMIDTFLIFLTVLISDWLLLIAYPLYFILCWTRFGTTPGKRLFHLIIRKDDGARLSLSDSIKRFAIVHWGFLAFLLIASVMQIAGIPHISIENGQITSPGNLAYQIAAIAVLCVSFSAWILGHFTSILRADRRSIYDLLAKTQVEYDHP